MGAGAGAGAGAAQATSYTHKQQHKVWLPNDMFDCSHFRFVLRFALCPTFCQMAPHLTPAELNFIHEQEALGKSRYAHAAFHTTESTRLSHSVGRLSRSPARDECAFWLAHVEAREAKTHTVLSRRHETLGFSYGPYGPPTVPLRSLLRSVPTVPCKNTAGSTILRFLKKRFGKLKFFLKRAKTLIRLCFYRGP